jgi:chemotaxis protein CheD
MRDGTRTVGKHHRYSDDGEAVGRQVRLLHGLDFDVYPVKIGPGEHHVTQRRGDMIITVLGSCVSACMRDPVARVGGMNHYMLPSSGDGLWDGGPPSMRFGSVAMEQLVKDVIAIGGQRERLEVKLVGGARMFDYDVDVGELNSRFGLDFLRTMNITPVSTDLRGTVARRVHYMPYDGRLWVKSLSRTDLETEGPEDVLWQDAAATFVKPARTGECK